MKFLKSRWYIWTSTGDGTGMVVEMPFKTKRDAERVLHVSRHEYQGWHIDKGEYMRFITNFETMKWTVI